MASLRQHPTSPFWYLRSRDLDTGRWVEKSTGLRTDNRVETRKAQRMAEKSGRDESQVGAPLDSPAFNIWVPDYLATHWRNKTGDSPRRYTTAWQAIKMFLNAHDITYPRQVKYHHGQNYITWRIKTRVHERKVIHNTALLELKFLSQLMNEAIRREFTEANPIARLGIGRAPQKEKPELTDEQLGVLNRHFSSLVTWMNRAFQIGLYTGCRFSECEIPVERIDLATNTLRLRDSKRGENDPRKFFSVPIHPQLRPTLQEVINDQEKVTCKLSRDMNGRINYEFRRAGVKATFHSLRVTFITRCHRSGVSQQDAMLLVNHSSQLIHRIYSRLNVEDVRAAQARIRLPSFDKETPAQPAA